MQSWVKLALLTWFGTLRLRTPLQDEEGTQWSGHQPDTDESHSQEVHDTDLYKEGIHILHKGWTECEYVRGDDVINKFDRLI